MLSVGVFDFVSREATGRELPKVALLGELEHVELIAGTAQLDVAGR